MAKKKRDGQTGASIEAPVMEQTDMQVISESGVTVITADFLEQTERTDDTPPAPNGRLITVGDGGNGTHIPQPTAQIIFEIDPENILIDPDLRALRAWSGGSAQELSLPQLAKTMYEDGQRYPVLMFQTDEGLVLYEGHRRREAAVIIREEYDATWMLKAILDTEMDADKALRAACLADSQHEKFTPMEIAHNIRFIRSRFDWRGGSNTAKVAEFLGVSPATVTQYERLAKAPESVQKDVEAGRLTPSAALDLISATSKVPEVDKEDVQAAVVEHAQTLANKDKSKQKRTPVTPEQAAIAKRTAEAAGRDRERRAMVQAQAEAEGKPAPELAPVVESTPTPAPVTGKHIRQAARQMLPDVKLKAPKMSEAVELIEQWAGPAYPAIMSAFAGTFADWGRGKKSNKVLEAAWDDIADALAGKKPKVTKAEKAIKASKPKPVKLPKVAAKKTVVKPAVKKSAKPAAKPAKPAAVKKAPPKKK